MRKVIWAVFLLGIAQETAHAQVLGTPQTNAAAGAAAAAAEAAKKAEVAAIAEARTRGAEAEAAAQARRQQGDAAAAADEVAKKATEVATVASQAVGRDANATQQVQAKANEAAKLAKEKEKELASAGVSADVTNAFAEAVRQLEEARREAHRAGQEAQAARIAAEAAQHAREAAQQARISELQKAYEAERKKNEEAAAAAEAERKRQESARAQAIAEASCPAAYDVLFPASEPRLARCFFDAESTLLSSAELALFAGGGSFYSELYRGVAGPLRLGFSVLAEKTTAAASAGAANAPSGGAGESINPPRTVDEKLSAGARFLQNGGNASASVHFPIVFSPFWSSTYFFVTSFARAGGDVPGLGGKSENPAIASEVGALGRLMLQSHPGNIGFKFEVRPAIVYGTDQFLDNIGRGSRRLFGTVQLSGGIVLGGTVEIKLVGTPGAPADVRPSLPKISLTTSLVNRPTRGQP